MPQYVFLGACDLQQGRRKVDGYEGHGTDLPGNYEV